MKSMIKLLGLAAIAAVLTFTMTACDTNNDNGNETGTEVDNNIKSETIIDEDGNEIKVCACIDTEHLKVGETCKCGADEGECVCTLKTYGFLTEQEIRVNDPDGPGMMTLGGAKIPIYKFGELAKGNSMESAVKELQRGYDLWKNGRVDLIGKITEIHVYDLAEPGNTLFGGALYYKKEGDKLILGFRYDAVNSSIIFVDIADGTLQPTIVN